MDTKQHVQNALALAIQRAGSQAALAALMGERYSQQQVSHWLRVGRIPADHVIVIERVTGVSRHDLSPSVFGDKYQSSGFVHA